MLIVFKFSVIFIISVNNSGFLLYVEMYAKDPLLLCFLGVCNSFNGIFSVYLNLLFINVDRYPR